MTLSSSSLDPVPLAARAAATARVFPTHPRSGRTRVVHDWLVALKWAFVIMAATTVVWAIETRVFGLKHTASQLIRNPTEFSVRFFGFAHYTVATVLLVTSRRLHNVRGLLLLAVFSVIVVLAWRIFDWAGGPKNKVAIAGVFLFFLTHALRDEVFFYRQRSGQAITDEEYPHVYRMLLWFQVFGLCLLGVLLYPAVIYQFVVREGRTEVASALYAMFPDDWPLALQVSVFVTPFVLVGAIAFAWIQRHHEGGVLALLRSHMPLTLVIAGTAAMALSTVLLGDWMFNVVILTHFTGWFVFAISTIQRTPRDARPTWRQPTQWIRRNLAGFWLFHGGLAVLFLAILAWNYWGTAQADWTLFGRELTRPLTFVFGPEALYYWTIAHVTLGFLPLPAAGARR